VFFSLASPWSTGENIDVSKSLQEHKGGFMSTYRLLPLMALMFLLASPKMMPGGELPNDAAKRIKEFEAEAEAIQKRANADINVRQNKLIEDLQALLEGYTRAGKLKEAEVIRDHIRPLQAARDKAQNLLVNGSFEEGPETYNDGVHNVDLDKGSTVIKGWETTRGGAGIIDSSYWKPADGKRSLALSKRPGQTECGGISQTFKTKKGQKYCVTFRLAGDPLHGQPSEKKLQISAAGMSAEFVFEITGKTRLDMGWVSKSWEFTADSDQTTLEFAGLTESIFGPALDDVVVLAVKK
jgi:choice-of-anchor C domain-containing protein